ncbi:hypothetical protein [Nocardia crassostreae]|uniref:hypothetical protein n=1 Tax=Nocardia crassostreae TaxID=53428 RepID=UPI00083204F3|nr:hypothetical protein [Nocardia crassostreae]
MAGAYGVDRRNTVRYTFSGRAARPLPTAAALDTWLGRTERLLSDTFSLTPLRRRGVVRRGWPTGYCAYLPFQLEFSAKLRHELSACFRSGLAAAEATTADLG